MTDRTHAPYMMKLTAPLAGVNNIRTGLTADSCFRCEAAQAKNVGVRVSEGLLELRQYQIERLIGLDERASEALN